MELIVDTAKDHDIPYVYDSWIQGYRESPRTCRWPWEAYAVWQRAQIDRLLPRSILTVARPVDWPEGVIGWLCAEQRDGAWVLHWSSVKQGFRRQGVLTALIAASSPQGRLVYSHLRPPFTDTLNRRGFVWDRTTAR